MSVCFSKLSILSAAYILIISPSCSERKKQPLDQKPEAHPTIPKTKPLAEKDEMVDLYKKASWSAINQDLHGTLITGKKTKPISLFYRKEGLQCLAGEQRIHLKFDHTIKGAYVVHDSNTKPTDKSRISAPLCHSAVTIEDFFLLTLKHQSIKLVGQENVSGQRCNKYRLIHSKSIGRYKISYAWVSRKSGILLRVTAYDQHGQPLQQIQITDLKKRNGQLQPLRIRFDAINPETNKFEKTSYLKLRSKLK